MDSVHYNTYTISDSDNSVVIEDQLDIAQHKNYRLSMSPEEPEFFSQVIQHQRKRKKSLSPKRTAHHRKNPPQGNTHNIDNRNNCVIGDNVKLNICESTEPKRKKRSTKEEIEEKKKEEKARKDAKKKLTEELKRLNPKECMKYMTVHIDINLQNQDYTEQILTEIQSTDAKYKIEANLNISHSVTWSRQISDTVSEDAKFTLLIWDFEYLKTIVTSNLLSKKISDLKLYNTQLSIIIYCSADQLKKTKSKKNDQFSKSNHILNSLEQMMLSFHVSFRFIDNKNDLGLAICYFTKSIAQKPYKLNKYKEEQEGCNWYASGHTKNCITIDKNGIGLIQLWRQMLSQFPLCALETSEAIASMYGSPIALLEAYDKCSSRLEGETLLQDIPVRRGFGPLASNRRIGPELSKKIYTFFTDNTGCTTLSQEQ